MGDVGVTRQRRVLASALLTVLALLASALVALVLGLPLLAGALVAVAVGVLGGLLFVDLDRMPRGDSR